MKNVFAIGLSCLCISCATVPPVTVTPPVEETSPIGEPIPEPISTVQCDITPSVNWMDNQTIKYAQSPNSEWRDCSGNFLRLSSHIAEQCDVELVAPRGVRKYVDGGDNERPGRAAARTTRGIAKWYDEQGKFVPVFYDGTVDLTEAPDALIAIRNKIKTGSVLWFSFEKPLAEIKKEGLFKEVGGLINHMATVTSVEKDDNGDVIAWYMYHGINDRKDNDITPQWWTYPDVFGDKKYPPGGYWGQRLVGFAESLVPDENINVVPVEKPVKL